MGYLFLAIALIAGVTKGYCGKMTSDYVNEYKDAMLANIIRMILCIIIGFIITILQSGIASFKIDITTLLISLLAGVSSSVFVVSWLICVKKDAYMLVDVFLLLGVVVPLTGSLFSFGETITLRQLAGLAILAFATLIMCSYNNSIKSKISLNALILLIICGVASGFSDFSQKLFVEYTDGVSTAVFNFYTYVFSAVFIGIFYIISPGKSSTSAVNLKHIFGYILLMSICLFANSYFQTKAAEYIPSAQLYPLSKGSSLILSSLMSSILFKEKLTLKCIMGIFLTFCALIMINL